MVIIHISNIDTSVIGGVQAAVPQMVRAQSKYADVGLVNTHGDTIDNIQMLYYDGALEIDKFPEPFNKPDIVVFHEVYRFEYIKIYRNLIKNNIPYIIVPHGCLSKKAQQKKRLKKIAANIVFFNGFMKSAKAIQYLSDNEKNMTAFPDYESFVFGNGVPISAERKHSFFNSYIKFVYIGRLEMRIKGLDILLKAVKKCETLMREKKAVVEIFGPDYGASHKSIRSMIDKLKIADIVRLDKEKIGEAKKEILLSADCFIQTSRTEGMPLGPLEALGYGVPCIVTEGVGLGKIIESFGAGFCCKNSVEGVANSIIKFIENINGLEAMSISAKNLIEKMFDVDLIANKTVDEYFNLINK